MVYLNNTRMDKYFYLGGQISYFGIAESRETHRKDLLNKYSPVIYND